MLHLKEIIAVHGRPHCATPNLLLHHSCENVTSFIHSSPSSDLNLFLHHQVCIQSRLSFSRAQAPAPYHSSLVCPGASWLPFQPSVLPRRCGRQQKHFILNIQSQRWIRGARVVLRHPFWRQMCPYQKCLGALFLRSAVSRFG